MSIIASLPASFSLPHIQENTQIYLLNQLHAQQIIDKSLSYYSYPEQLAVLDFELSVLLKKINYLLCKIVAETFKDKKESLVLLAQEFIQKIKAQPHNAQQHLILLQETILDINDADHSNSADDKMRAAHTNLIQDALPFDSTESADSVISPNTYLINLILTAIETILARIHQIKLYNEHLDLFATRTLQTRDVLIHAIIELIYKLCNKLPLTQKNMESGK